MSNKVILAFIIYRGIIVVVLLILLILILIIAARVVYELYNPEIKRYSVKTDKLAPNDKIRIVYISDLHSRKYGKNNIRLIKMISKIRPDFIVLGGDMVTASIFQNKDENTLDALNGFTNIAPVFYAPGNHEKKLSKSERNAERFEDYMFELECMDISYLCDQKAVLTEQMYIYGLDIDLVYYKKFGHKPRFNKEYIAGKLGEPDKKAFNILVAHTPEYFDTYVTSGYDLVLCGHYHGGMINIPGIGPLLSPDLKFKPEHASGAYKKSGTMCIVSRGIGSHLLNIRIFNRPEIGIIDIKQEG